LVSQPQKSVTLQPQPGGETTKSIRDGGGGGGGCYVWDGWYFFKFINFEHLLRK
jgi:hypothetical protein